MVISAGNARYEDAEHRFVVADDADSVRREAGRGGEVRPRG